jgi:radical SAM protein with 4Fe4S-binding SPASM domain
VNKISFLAVDVSSVYAFGPRFTADPALQVVAGGGIGAMPDHGPAATALTHDDLPELEGILDDVERDYATEFANGRMAESPEKLRRILLQYFSAINGESAFPRPRCNAPHFSTVIEVDGTLRPCYFLPSYGRLRRQNDGSLQSVMNSDAAQALRKAYRSGQRAECERCVCPLYKGPRALMDM